MGTGTDTARSRSPRQTAETDNRPPASGYRRGELARAAGVNVETIRYYQRLGLLARPPRPVRGTRRYPAAALKRLRFIKHAQGLGFSLAQIAELLALTHGACDDVRRLAEQQRDRVQARIRDLQAIRKTLDELIAGCHDHDTQSDNCPFLENLLED